MGWVEKRGKGHNSPFRGKGGKKGRRNKTRGFLARVARTKIYDFTEKLSIICIIMRPSISTASFSKSGAFLRLTVSLRETDTYIFRPLSRLRSSAPCSARGSMLQCSIASILRRSAASVALAAATWISALPTSLRCSMVAASPPIAA